MREKELSPHTIETYSRVIKQYGNKEINTSLIVSFLKKNLVEYEPTTLQLKKWALASYAKFNKAEIDWEKVARIIPNSQKKFFITIDKQELASLKEVRFEINENIYQRNNLILDLLFYTGIRVSELISIKKRD